MFTPQRVTIQKKKAYATFKSQNKPLEDAVSPVIGVILMVAITVILAAVIAAFVFGMGPPEQAPQASLRGSAETVGDNKTVKIEHQGGDNFYLSNVRIVVNETPVSTMGTNLGDNYEFVAGSTIYVFNDDGTMTIGLKSDASSATNTSDVGTPSSTVNVKIVDTASQQMIADMNVRF
ncbi:hypothetical protein Mpsy_2389 [Methanolobus psychrophilus R15]|nr:hypothetical protein Mpsy_2389 [Methanolobus psychrophilus R15]